MEFSLNPRIIQVRRFSYSNLWFWGSSIFHFIWQRQVRIAMANGELSWRMLPQGPDASAGRFPGEGSIVVKPHQDDRFSRRFVFGWKFRGKPLNPRWVACFWKRNILRYQWFCKEIERGKPWERNKNYGSWSHAVPLTGSLATKNGSFGTSNSSNNLQHKNFQLTGTSHNNSVGVSGSTKHVTLCEQFVDLPKQLLGFAQEGHPRKEQKHDPIDFPLIVYTYIYIYFPVRTSKFTLNKNFVVIVTWQSNMLTSAMSMYII